MIAVWSPRSARCRSMQFSDTLRAPSSNQRMWKSSLLKETSLTRVNGVRQESRSPIRRQKASGAVAASSQRR